MNLKMPALEKVLEQAGFTEVKTLLSSGNVVFRARAIGEAALERKVETALTKHAGKSFLTIVRSIEALSTFVDSNPFAKYHLETNAKRVVTFVRRVPKSTPKLPIERDGARILCLRDRELLSVYVPGPRGPVFMTLIEKTLGKDVTTRTWETVSKVVRAGLG